MTIFSPTLHDWTSQMERDWLREVKPRFAGKCIDVLEIGVFEGRSATWFIENLFTVPGCQYVGIDTWRGAPEMAHLDLALMKEAADRNIGDAIARLPFRADWALITGKSRDVLPGLFSKSFNLVYVDGSHAYEDARRDIREALRLVKPGGIILVDDVTDFPGVARAAREILGVKDARGQRQLIIKVPIYEPT